MSEKLMRMAHYLLHHWLDQYGELDPSDLQDVLYDAGILADGKVTQADMEDGWPGDFELELGDSCLRVTDFGKQVRDFPTAPQGEGGNGE